MLKQFQSGGTGQLQDSYERPVMAFHEFYQDDFRPRDHYLPMWEHIQIAGQQMLGAKARDAHLALHNEGVTFTVYSDADEGIERVWPFDILPRIIPAAEWNQIESGLKQRIQALNLFLKDLYHGQRILKDGVVPPELIYRGQGFPSGDHGYRSSARHLHPYQRGRPDP